MIRESEPIISNSSVTKEISRIADDSLKYSNKFGKIPTIKFSDWLKEKVYESISIR